MQIYLDSNIILSQYIENDKFHGPNKLILQQKELSFCTGFISLIEIKSVIRKLWRNGQLKIEPGIQKELENFSEAIQVQRLVDYCVQRLPVQVVNIWLPEHITFNTVEYEIDSIQNFAYRMASVLDLKSLDLIQIASAMSMKLYGKIVVEYFLTNDFMILENIKQIRQTTKIQAISSLDLINILKIT